jgi:hypothetical protein
MGIEEPLLLAFPYPLDLLISKLLLISKGILKKLVKTCKKKNIEHHSTSFHEWVPGKIITCNVLFLYMLCLICH